jgi:hypothetical protein
MELTAKRKSKVCIPRAPCQELNFQFPPKQQANRLIKPVNSTNLSVQVSQKTSADNSFSLSPLHMGVPLSFVTPSHVSISMVLQKTIKSRSKSKNTKRKQKTSFFARNEEWKKETDTKVLKLKQEKDRLEMSLCTFAPKLKKVTDRSRLTSRRSSGLKEIMKKDLENQKSFGMMEKFVAKTFDDYRQDDIDQSFQRVTLALDAISKQISETINAGEC